MIHQFSHYGYIQVAKNKLNDPKSAQYPGYSYTTEINDVPINVVTG
jgi:hypothetical protein